MNPKSTSGYPWTLRDGQTWHVVQVPRCGYEYPVQLEASPKFTGNYRLGETIIYIENEQE